MAFPFSRLTTYLPRSAPAIQATDLNAIQDQIVTLSFAPFLFGDGSDGNTSLDGSVAAPSWATKSGSIYSLSRDVFLNNCTLSGTAQIKTNGFRMFVKGVLTIGASCKVHCNGANGVAHNGGTNSPSAGTLGYGESGGTGGTVGDHDGNPGGNVTVSLGGSGGNGGIGDDGGATGSIGGVATAPAAALGGWRSLQTMFCGYLFGLSGLAPTLSVIRGGAGGGGGGVGNNGGDTSNGGGGGGAAGVMVLFARWIINSGAIEARGGNGGNAVLVSGAGWQAGGGGAGGGGVIFLGYGLYEGSGTKSVAGGVGGSGMAGGTNGAAGATGTLVELQAVA